MASRLAQALVTILGISVIVFSLAHLSGSDPASLLIPPDATNEQRAQFREDLGLNRSLVEQYTVFLKDAARGDFGTSFYHHRPALDVYWGSFPNTLELAAAASVIALAFGISVGMLGAVRSGSWGDRLGTIFAMLGQSVPSFWLGIVLIMIFSVELGWLPTSGKADWRTFIMPAVTLSWFSMAALTRITRSSMLDVLDADYIKLARLKGLPERTVIWKHGFRNAALPVLTLFSLQLITFVSGSVIVENVFAWPGIGRLTVDAIRTRDYPMLQAGVLITSSLLVLLNLGVDLLYAVIDPRIRLA